MDAFLPALCLAVGIALPVGMVYLVLRRGWWQLSVAEAYRTVSEQLGLEVDTRGVSLHGHLGDRRIYVGEILKSAPGARRLEFRGILSLDRPLGLGLFLRKRSGRPWFLRKGQKPVKVGDETFDKAVEVFGDDDERIRSLTSPEVRRAVLSLIEGWHDLTVNDHVMRVHLRRPEPSAERLIQLVHAMRLLADSLVESRRQVKPPPSLAALAEPWGAIATRYGLSVEPWLPALTGEMEGHRVQVCPRREAEGYRAEIRVWFPKHRTLGLRLTPQVEPDGYWSVGQDIQVGDPPFDRAFVVKGYNPDTVREHLTEPVRADLLKLARHATVDVDDHLVEVRDAPLEAEQIEDLLSSAVRVAVGLAW